MPNKLQFEQSPYLLQHSHNPVDWYPWGDEAFARANAENKPVLVSIGYAACHWCHVMERESFENGDVAAFMNEHFICIKVDREEHPDVDHMYMDAVTAISGSGGWPLNVFVTPDKSPFYGGTYFPPRPAYNRPSWIQLLSRMAELWREQHGEVLRQAEQMIQHLHQAAQVALSGDTKNCTLDDCRRIAEDLLQRADKEKGGFGGAPKFPGTMAISFLLEHYRFTGYEPALKHALVSLDAMAAGGIYDQLGGGFARYSTDKDWLAPHFEKMLYDNALLVAAYCDAYSITGNKNYEIIINETINFTERELKDVTGGYYCAIDADSEGLEGKFYTWTWEDFTGTLKDNHKIPAAYFGVTETGNWEHTNILHVAKSIQHLTIESKLSIEQVIKSINEAKQILINERGKRVRPITDDKCLLSWNALMNISLTKAGIALKRRDYVQQATKHMNWMLEHFQPGGVGVLYHTWKNGTARLLANLDDYAYLVQALLLLASTSGDNGLILKAAELTETVMQEFINKEGGYFFFTSEQQKDIPVRKMDIYDGATPSGNAVMAHNLLLCGLCVDNMEWIDCAEEMLLKIKDTTIRYSYSFAYWGMLMQRKSVGLKTVICAGKQADAMRDEIFEKYLPQAYVLTLKKEISNLPLLENKYFVNKNHIFVCSQQACQLPVSIVDQAIKQIES